MISVHPAARRRAVLVTGSAILAITLGGFSTVFAQESDATWPSIDSCEPWIHPEVQSGGEADARRAAALIDHLQGPESSYELAFRTRMARGGAIFADGEQMDIDVPVVTADFVGNALVDRSDYLAYLALSNGPWSLAEMRRDGDLRSRWPTAELPWQTVAAAGETAVRLPDALANATSAVLVAAPAGQDGHWYALQTSADMGPGIVWDNTRDLFPVLRDVEANLFIEAAEDGSPVRACLDQGWWQGYDDVFGEDSSMRSAIRFTRVGSAPPLPPVSWPSELARAGALDLEVPVPLGGETKSDGDVFWVWLDDQDELPSLRIARSRIPNEGLVSLRQATIEQVLEGMAQYDAASAKVGWNTDPLTVEPARIGGAGGETPVPARLLTFHPQVDGFGTVVAIDIVAFVDPWSYHFQYLAPLENELSHRYLLERTLEGIRFLCSPDGGAACPPALD